MPLTSTPMHPDRLNHPPEWALDGLRYFPLGRFLQERFGRRVWKISVDAGTSCPNLDGTVARGGCIFCDMRSFSPSRRRGGSAQSVEEQIADGASRLRRRYGERAADTFIAYFQPATNTYGPVDRLLPLWQEAIEQPGVVGLAVGTRPDCVGDDVLDALTGIAEKSWVSVELGLQSIHQRSLDWLQRGHDYHCFESAVCRIRSRGLHVCAHLMLGLPGETATEIVETGQTVARLGVDAVKLHNLYVVRDTPLAAMWKRGEFVLPSRDEYVRYLVDLLEHLRTDCVIDRIVGDAPPQYLLAPEWCRDKAAVKRAVEHEFHQRGTRQGSHWSPPFHPLSQGR